RVNSADGALVDQATQPAGIARLSGGAANTVNQGCSSGRSVAQPGSAPAFRRRSAVQRLHRFSSAFNVFNEIGNLPPLKAIPFANTTNEFRTVLGQELSRHQKRPCKRPDKLAQTQTFEHRQLLRASRRSTRWVT